MTERIKEKLALLPKSPGVYFHKNSDGTIIYIGKAAVLRNRVRQYFQKSRYRDPKTDALVSEIADIDWIEVDSEVDALFLEAELIRRYLPQYNILLRDDKSNTYVRINLKDHAPSVTLTRRPIDDNATYFGPYLQSHGVKKAVRYLRKIFPYSTHEQIPKRACLQYHLGLCPGPETPEYDRDEYMKHLRQLIRYIKGDGRQIIRELDSEMHQASKNQDFELAAQYRNKLLALKSLQNKIIFSDRENLDLSKDHALYELFQMLNLKKPPARIEGYDISHMSGTDTVASMVVFTNGIADKGSYRKFKMRLPGNDDFAHMQEVIKRRFRADNSKKWRLPDILLIDGGKGQLTSAITSRDKAGFNEIPAIGLAKKYEQIVVHKKGSAVDINFEYIKSLKGHYSETGDFIIIDLPDTSNIVKLLQRIRDESHRFAVSYHSTLKRQRQTKSELDDIPGVGPDTKKRLLREFGSLHKIRNTSEDQLRSLIGPSKAKKVFQSLNSEE